MDLVSGGPPCQPFSLGGKHRGHGDHRICSPKPYVLSRDSLRAFLSKMSRD
ncbi:MAG: DNA cytosine methyltransferase [Candidatus Competibacteraceae bacterium]